MTRPIVFSLACLLFGTSAEWVDASGLCGRCGSPSHGHLVQKTIMVPTRVTETRMKTKVVKKRVAKEESYTVFQRVPVTQKYEKETCYLENGVKTQTITQKKCHRVKNPVTRTYSVQVPVEEFQEGVASCDDCTAGGQGGSGAACTCKTRMRKETRTAQCEVDDVVFETITKEISYCVKVPKKHKEICAEETIYKLQPVQKTRTVEVCVPEIIKVPVETCVTKMVPKTIHCCERCAKHH